jgi:Cu-Zn family superoxide dismutase
MKNHLAIALLLVTAAFTSSCSVSTGNEVANAKLATTADGKDIGSAKFYLMDDGKVKMDLEINYPERADSTVAVHFHEHGDCGNKGENAHGHWNPTNEAHGKWGAAAYHSGDIGNIELDSKGHGKVSITSDRWNVTDNDVSNIIGRGIIVHGGTDDYTTQPTGNSGPRVGCGVIVKK